MTNKNPKIALDGYIRVFKSKDSAKQWTSDEANQLEKKGFRVLEQDTTVQAGNSEWHKLVWEGMMPTHGQQLAVRGEQYYFKGEETMIEVMIGGPPPLFDHLDHNELIQFLTSSNFSEKPKSSNETNAPVVDTRLCAPQDVLGSWELTFVEPQVNDGPDAYLYGYQRCYFGSDGKTKLLTSNKPFDDLTDIVWKNFPTNASYELDKKGIIAINDPGVGRIQYQACQIATGDSTKIKKGDMLLKSYRAEGAVHSIVKGFRKIGNNG